MTDIRSIADLAPELASRVEGLSPGQRARLEQLVRRRLDGDGAIRPAAGSGPWLASLAQERMWLGSDLDAGANIYATVVRLRGPLSLPALRAGLIRIVQRHEALRTAFQLTAEGLVQWIDPQPRLPLRFVDLGGLGLGAGPDLPPLVRTLARDMAGRPFELTRGPLLRIVVFRLSPHDHCVLLAIHHAVTDAWSHGVLARELATGYQDVVAGRPWSAPPLTVQYKDYAAWQRERLDGPEAATLERFWAGQLNDLPRLDLPVDAARLADGRGSRHRTGAGHTFVIDAGLRDELAALRLAEGGSWYMLVLAAFVAVLRAVTGQSDLVVGTLAAERARPEFEGLIGSLFNVLPLRFRSPGEPTFRELWSLVREQARNAYAHQEMPYEKMLRLLRAGQVGGQEAPFRVMCVPHAAMPDVSLPGLVARTYDIDLGYALFDLVATVAERPDGLQVTFQYDTGLFTAPAVTVLAGYLRTVLDRVVSDPDVPCSELLTGRTGPEPAVAGPAGAGTVHSLVEEQAARTPDAVAVIDDDLQLSYRALNARANQLARHLRAAGVRAEEPVGVCLPRSATAITALLAILKTGAPYVPLDPGHPPARLAAIAADAGIQVLVTTSGVTEIPEFGGRTVLLDAGEEHIRARPAADLRLPVSPHQAAYLIFTSGSTGRPKGVVGLHGGLVNRIRWMRRDYPVRADDICAVRTPLTFGDSMCEIFGPLDAGAVLAVVPDSEGADPELLADRLERLRVSRIVVVPALLTMLLDGVADPGRRLSGLRTWSTSGEELNAGLAARLHRCLPGVRLLNLYGSSEVSADATVTEVPPLPEARVPIGRPLDGISVRVGDRRLNSRPPLVPGEVYIGGCGVARGYHGRPGETAAVFVPDPHGGHGSRAFRTGDLARQRADGSFEYLGRRDAQVQIRGHRVEPGEVEKAMLSHPEVSAAAVTARADTGGSMTLVGYVVPGPGLAGDPRLDDLRAFLSRRLPPYLVPSILMAVEALPRTGGGKIDRRSLPEPRPATVGTSAPRGPVEVVVAAAFADVLGLPEVGRDDDFFLIGGHSLLASQLVRILGDRFGVRLGLADLFDTPTVAGLAARIGASPDAALAGPPVLRPDPGRWFEPFPLTDVQAAYYVGRETDLRLGGVSTHTYLELATDDFDHGRFTAALRALIGRHQMLRAVMRPDGTQQVLAEVPAYEMTTYDLRSLPAGEQEERVAAVRDEMSNLLLGPYTWPLFDVRVSLLGSSTVECRALVHVGLDSLICDAYSFLLVMDELSARYRGTRDGYAALDVAFRDYVLHQAGEQTAERRAAALEHWRRRLPSLPPGPELPVVGLVDDPGGQRFVRRDGRLAEPAWSALKERAMAHGLTPSGILLAAFAEIITAWSRHPRYSVMLTVFNRDPVHPQIFDLVGDFTSLVALEVDHSEPAAFVDRARTLQRRLWSDLDHSAVSAVTVTREWALARGLAPQPITPVVFTSNLPFAAEEAVATPARRGPGKLVYGITRTPQVHLDHQVGELDGELLFNWDAVDALFAAGVLDDMFAAYQALLEQLAARPEDWARPVHAALPAAQIARRAAMNDTAAPLPDHCLHHAVGAAADRHPHRVALIDGETRMTYGELMSRARRVGRTVRALGARPNTLVAVAARRGWQQVVAAVGVSESGAGFLPLDPDLPAERVALLARRGEIALALTQADLLDALPPVPGVRFVAVDDDSGLSRDDRPLDPVAEPGDLAYVIFTSGSTGEPKGVAIDHRAAVNTIASVNRRFEIGPDDRVLAVSSLSFDLAIYDLFGLLGAGGTVVLPDDDRRRDPGHWARLVSRGRVTVWNSVPALAELLVDHAEAVDPDALGSLRLVLLSGDWIPVGLPDRIKALTGARVMSLGGATEASIWSVWYPIGRVEPEWRSIPYGAPMANQTMHVLDGALRDRPDWVAGELYIAGAGVAREYWRDPELTGRSFLTHPDSGRRLYRTGDIARYLPDGNLEFLGREDGQVKINGFRVEIGEIVAALDRIDGVRSAAVVAVDGAGGGRRLVGLLVPADPATFDPERIRASLVRTLPDYMVPTGWVVLDGLPLTGNGKLDNDALRRLADRPPAPSDVDAATRAEPGPAGRLTEELCELWREVLAVETVGPQDSFFALGGTSLVAIRMLARLQQATGVRISLPQLFGAATVAELAEVIDAMRRRPDAEVEEPPTAEPDPESSQEPFPLTDIQQAYWIGRNAGNTLGGVATHSYVEMDVTDLDVPRLENALNRLIDRHDALRTVVLPDGSQQVLGEVPRYRVPTTDLRHVPPDEARLAGASLRAEMSHEVRDIGRWPLFGLRAQRLDAARTRLYLSVDLMVMDARSMQILADEMLTLYTDPDAELPAIGLTFRDYVVAAQRLRHTAAYRRARDYWQDRLPTLPPAPALPMISRPEELTGAVFERVGTEVDEPTWRALRAWAAAAGITPTGLLCAAFCEALAAWSEAPRFTLNLTTYNRIPVHPDVDALVGDFTATTLVAVDGAGASFVDRARRIQEQIWRDLEHRIVSGVEVQRMLRREPSFRAGAIMPVVFTSALFPGDAEPKPPRWQASPVYALSQTPQVLLDHQVTEHAGRLTCTWDYVAAAFPPRLVSDLFAAFERVLTALADPSGRSRPETGGVQHDDHRSDH